MNHTELLKALNDETALDWEDSSERHGWTVQAHLGGENWLTAAFPEGSETSAPENGVVSVMLTNESGDLLFDVQFPITHAGMFGMYGFVNGLSVAIL